MFQSVLPLHKCVDPAATESIVAESAVEPLHSVADSTAAEPLQSVANSAAAGAALTETS
jgi:hypothetical protein